MKTSPQSLETLSKRLPQLALHDVLGALRRPTDGPAITLEDVRVRLERKRGDLRIEVGLALARIEPKDAERDFAHAKDALSGDMNPFIQDVREIVAEILGIDQY